MLLILLCGSLDSLPSVNDMVNIFPVFAFADGVDRGFSEKFRGDNMG